MQATGIFSVAQQPSSQSFASTRQRDGEDSINFWQRMQSYSDNLAVGVWCHCEALEWGHLGAMLDMLVADAGHTVDHCPKRDAGENQQSRI